MGKRVLCLFLALTAVLALAAPALADGTMWAASPGDDGARTPHTADDHVWSVEITAEPGYLNTGVLTRTCIICGKTEEEDILRLEPACSAQGAADSVDQVLAEQTLRDTAAAVAAALSDGGTTSALADETAAAVRASLRLSTKQTGASVAAVLSVKDITGTPPEDEPLETPEEEQAEATPPGGETAAALPDDAGEKADEPDGVLVELINESVTGQAVRYYDIHVTAVVNGAEAGLINETTAPIPFALPIPAGTGPIVYLVRAGEDEAVPVDTQVRDGKLWFETERFSTFAIVSTDDIAAAEIAPIPAQTYTGQPAEPAVTVTVQGPEGRQTLTEGQDFTVAYEDNGTTGTAAAVITGAGRFTGTKRAAFMIKAPAGEEPAGGGVSPGTGDGTPLAWYGGLLALCLAGLALLPGRRKARDKR